VSSDDVPEANLLEESTEELREEYADAFGLSADPLKQYSSTFADLPDPFVYFITTVLLNRDSITTQDTIDNYHRTYEQWRDHMSTTDRHPACPSSQQVCAFIEWRRDVHANTRRTIKKKLNHLSQAYNLWQEESVFPHPSDYSPFAIGRKRTNLGDKSDKSFHDLTFSTLQEIFNSVENVRSRGIIGTQLKLGLRASELCNLKLQDIHLNHKALQELYPELGTHPALEGYTNAAYIPPDRDGNKSDVPRLLPIDEELRWLLIHHLIPRPQVDEPWVFLSRRTLTQMSLKGLNNPWKEAFRPEYGETDDHRAITSHFGRHWFSSYLRLEIGLSREHVQYMRGDRVEPLDDFPDAIDDYLHPHYEHIEEPYRNNVFKLDIPMRHYSK